MTKKHFESFAKAIKARNKAMSGAFGVSEKEQEIAMKEMINLVCDVAKEHNPRFKRDTFLAACGF